MMREALFGVISQIQKDDAVIISGFSIDERIVARLLEDKIKHLSQVRLVYQYGRCRSMGFLKSHFKERFQGELIRSPILISTYREKPNSVYHSKFFCVVDGKSGNIKAISLGSFNWTNFHFSIESNVFESQIVITRSEYGEFLDPLLKLKEYSGKIDLKPILVPPKIVYVELEKGKGQLRIINSQIEEFLKQTVVSNAELVAAPFINKTGLKKLKIAPDEFAGIFRIRESEGNHLHGKFILGYEMDGERVIHVGSLNYTENAVSGNNHETFIKLRSVDKGLYETLKNRLSKFQSWPEFASSEKVRQEEPEEAYVLPEIPILAQLGSNPKFAFLNLEFHGSIPSGLKLYLVGSGCEPYELIKIKKSGVRKLQALLFNKNEIIPQDLKNVLNSMLYNGFGQLKLSVKNIERNVDLDLGPLWQYSEDVFKSRTKAKLGAKRKKKRDASEFLKVHQFKSLDIRNGRKILSKLDQNNLLCKAAMDLTEEKSDFVSTWKLDPWCTDE